MEWYGCTPAVLMAILFMGASLADLNKAHSFK